MPKKGEGLSGTSSWDIPEREQVKEIDPEVTVIMMTGYSEEELVRRAISQGAYTCIYKPFDVERILILIGQISRQRSK